LEEKQQMSTKTPIQFRQGDVFVIKVAELPKKVKPLQKDKGRTVLEYGEVTGHAHAISDPEVLMFASEDNRRFLVIDEKKSPKGAQLKHEEHATIDIPAGTYEVRRQHTYSAGAQMAMRVAD
jgi:hypothetical protein